MAVTTAIAAIQRFPNRPLWLGPAVVETRDVELFGQFVGAMRRALTVSHPRMKP